MIRGSTKIVGIFGDPVVYTLSPKMQNAAFSQLHLDFVYVPFVVQEKDLKSAVASIKSLNLHGVNVTIPHKRSILPYLDELSPLAKKIGAVNTILNRSGRLIGHNTDAPGFLSSLKEDGPFNPEGKRALLLGSGGTAHAISISLLDSGIESLRILNRTLEKAEELKNRLRKSYPNCKISSYEFSEDILKENLESSDIFLNATPSGLESIDLPHFKRFLPQNLFVFDAVYAKVTPLITVAKEAGVAALGGLGMLVRQGALSFSIWTGLEPPTQIMMEALNRVE